MKYRECLVNVAPYVPSKNDEEIKKIEKIINGIKSFELTGKRNEIIEINNCFK